MPLDSYPPVQEYQSPSVFEHWDGITISSCDPSYSVSEALAQAEIYYLADGYVSPPPAHDSTFSSLLSSAPSMPSLSPPTANHEDFASTLIQRLTPLVESTTPTTPPPRRKRTHDGHDGATSASTSPTINRTRQKQRKKAVACDPCDPPTDVKPLTEAQARRKKRKKEMARANARAKEEVKDLKFSRHRTRPNVEKKYVAPAQELKIPATAADMEKNVATGAYIGTNDNKQSNKTQTPLEKLVGENSMYRFRYVAWNGRDPVPIVSQDGYLLGLLAGNPDHEDWPRLQKEAADALEDARCCCQVDGKDRRHRRGNFTTLRTGISHGGGPKKLSNASNNNANDAILKYLNNLEVFNRISGFSNSVMAIWAPDLYSHYTTTVSALYESDRDLVPAFSQSVFTAMTYNLGPRTVCFKHRDWGNLSYGWCAVTAFGDYDYEKGGHLILWDLKLVIEFPPGATILIPSAIVSHSNVPVSKSESRYSFTQYTAGGIFRWVENGFRNADTVLASFNGNAQTKAAYVDKLDKRWMHGLSFLPRRQ